MKNCWYLFIALGLFACSEENEPEAQEETYEVSIVPSLDALNISEGGRIASDSAIATYYSYELFDNNCSQVDSYGDMVNDGILPQLILPNIQAGTYHYRIHVGGDQNIEYDTAGSFTITSDTVLEATLRNRQMRYRFEEKSDFAQAEVEMVSYQLNYETFYYYLYENCSGLPGYWSSYNDDWYVSESVWDQYDTYFNYHTPIDIVSVMVKFWAPNSQVIKSYIIPVEMKLLEHHSYTFEINLSAIWDEAASGSAILLNVEEVDWTEETVVLN